MKSIAHQASGMNHYGQTSWPDGLVPWNDSVTPFLGIPNRTIGRLRGCGYCGSMHPVDLAAAIREGAEVHWADWKYGWPHKLYIDGIPNPHAGMLESRGSCTNPSQAEIDAGKWVRMNTGSYDQNTGKAIWGWFSAGAPAADKTHGKFYTLHLQDATPEDRAVIEARIGLSFEFVGQQVTWKSFALPT